MGSGPLRGQIQQGVYRDPLRWFEITLPYHPDEDSYARLRVDEDKLPNVEYASFMPLTAPGEYYRVYIEDFKAGGHPVPELPQVANMAMSFFVKRLVESRVEPMELVEERHWPRGSMTGLIRLYTEKVPTELLMQNLGMAEDYTAYILMYVTARDGKVVMLWTEWPEDCPVCTPALAALPTDSSDPMDKAMVLNRRAMDFIDSFKFAGG